MLREEPLTVKIQETNDGNKRKQQFSLETGSGFGKFSIFTSDLRKRAENTHHQLLQGSKKKNRRTQSIKQLGKNMANEKQCS